LANYATHGNSDTFGINWSEIVPDWPSLSATFQTGSNQYSIYGANDSGSTNSRSFSLRSSYLLSGFNLSAYFSDGDSHSNIPQVLEGSSQPETATSSNRGYGFAVGHQLPLHGGFSGKRQPLRCRFRLSRLQLQRNDRYLHRDRSLSADPEIPLFGQHRLLRQSFGQLVPGDHGDGRNRYAPGARGVIARFRSARLCQLCGDANLQALASADHRQQFFEGKSYGADSYGGGLTYGRVVLGGNLNTAFTLTENTVSTSSANELGFNGTVNYNKRFDGWTAGVFANYAQNVQTLLITYMSSYYGYGGNIRRRWGRFGWTAGASFNKTGLTEQAGTSSSSQSYNSSVSYSPWININATLLEVERKRHRDRSRVDCHANAAADPDSE
jgi:hypothetical protein